MASAARAAPLIALVHLLLPRISPPVLEYFPRVRPQFPKLIRPAKALGSTARTLADPAIAFGSIRTRRDRSDGEGGKFKNKRRGESEVRRLRGGATLLEGPATMAELEEAITLQPVRTGVPSEGVEDSRIYQDGVGLEASGYDMSGEEMEVESPETYELQTVRLKPFGDVGWTPTRLTKRPEVDIRSMSTGLEFNQDLSQLGSEWEKVNIPTGWRMPKSVLDNFEAMTTKFQDGILEMARDMDPKGKLARKIEKELTGPPIKFSKAYDKKKHKIVKWNGAFGDPDHIPLPGGKWTPKLRRAVEKAKKKMPEDASEREMAKRLKALMKRKFPKFNLTQAWVTLFQAHDLAKEMMIPRIKQLQSENDAVLGNKTKMQELLLKRMEEFDEWRGGYKRIFVEKPVNKEHYRRLHFAHTNNYPKELVPVPNITVLDKERIRQLIPKIRPPRFGELTEKLFLRNLHFDLQESTLRRWAEGFGQLEDLRMHHSGVDGKFLGSAILTYANISSAVAALRLSGHRLMNRVVKVQMMKPTKTIYAFGISKHVDRNRIERFFKPCGRVVELTWLKDGDNFTGNVAIEFATTDEAIKAVEEKFGSQLAGQSIRLELARLPRLKEERLTQNVTTVLVGNLLPETSEGYLRDTFQSCGGIRNVRVMRHVTSGPTTVAFIDFNTTDGLLNAMSRSGTVVNNKRVSVKVGHSSPVLWVMNLPSDVLYQEVYRFFQQSGEIVDLEVRELSPGNLGARVTMASISNATHAVNRDSEILKGNRIRIEFARPRALPHYYARPRRPLAVPALPKKWLNVLGRREAVKLGLSTRQLKQKGLDESLRERGEKRKIGTAVSKYERLERKDSSRWMRDRMISGPKPMRTGNADVPLVDENFISTVGTDSTDEADLAKKPRLD